MSGSATSPVFPHASSSLQLLAVISGHLQAVLRSSSRRRSWATTDNVIYLSSLSGLHRRPCQTDFSLALETTSQIEAARADFHISST